jgi:hypothetical protein
MTPAQQEAKELIYNISLGRLNEPERKWKQRQ